jgi:hypothetical protein
MNLTGAIRFPFSCLAAGVLADPANEAFHRETDSLHDCPSHSPAVRLEERPVAGDVVTVFRWRRRFCDLDCLFAPGGHSTGLRIVRQPPPLIRHVRLGELGTKSESCLAGKESRLPKLASVMVSYHSQGKLPRRYLIPSTPRAWGRQS